MSSIFRFIFLLLVGIVPIATAQSPVPKNAVVEMIASGFQFVEGPVWKDGTGLLFSDMRANVIYQWSPAAGASVYRASAGNSNGLTFDSQGRLIINQTGYRRVVRLDSAGRETILAATYGGKRLNSPNDVVVKSDGSILFTDPPFNIPAGQKAELSFSGIFRITPTGGLYLIDSSLSLPNGICFSPDESKLYVNNSSERVIYVWDVLNDSTFVNKRRFASITPVGYADGMKVDPKGNLFCSGPVGIWVFSPDGALLDTIKVPGGASNCNWGDASRMTLYITAGTAVYRLRLVPTGVEDRPREEEKGSEGMQGNYPNPFNSRTTISYQLPAPSGVEGSAVSLVDLKVLDLLGREIATLVNERRPAGLHTVAWDAVGYPSGVYLLHMTLERENGKFFRQVAKMVLMK